MANIKARQKLSALYDRGVEVRFGPDPETGEMTEQVAPGGKGYFKVADAESPDYGKRLPLPGDWVAMWVQPPNPLQREQAMRDAQAARARALVRAKRDETSEEHLTVMAFISEMDDETLLEYVLIQTHEERQNDAIREVLASDEWKDMEAYRDSMRIYHDKLDSGEMTFAELEEDSEWAALMEVDQKYGDQVQRRLEELTDAERDVLKMQLDSSRQNLERMAIKHRAEQAGTQAFAYEYELQMQFYSVRDIDDHGVLVYTSARELAEQDEAILDIIREANHGFIHDTAEAKNSSRAVSGSESSEPPSEPETSAASTPETATA